MQIRFATAGAAAGWAEVVLSASPFQVSSAESVRHDMAHHRGTLARYVAVENERVLGVARVRTGPPGEVAAMVQVHAAHQGQGVGGLLLDRVLRVANGRDVTGVVNGDDHSRGVSARWGFRPDAESPISFVVPAGAPAPAAAPVGLDVVPLSALAAEQAWSCHQASAPDDPSGLSLAIPLEEYVATQWQDPLHRPDLGRAVLQGPRVLAFTQVSAAGDRAWNSMTGTLPEARGRGLARLVKAHALAAMARSGIAVCSTGNAAENAAMLAVNAGLGYRRTTSVWISRRPGRADARLS